MRINSITFDKPIYVGMTILSLSKLLMYEFYYDVLLKKYGDNVELLAMDTDSFFLNIKTADVYEDLKELKNHFDFSDYPRDHPLYDVTNKKVPGFFKDELLGELMTEACFVKAKLYGYKTLSGKEIKKCKGVARVTVKKYITFEDLTSSLFYGTCKMATQHQLNSINHEIFLNEVNKLAISPFDDKRFICNDGITTFPHGYINRQ
jgi:hypothetical protein